MVIPQESGSEQVRRLSSSQPTPNCDSQVTRSRVHNDGSETPLSYRQERRKRQAINSAEVKPKRGPTKGLKSQHWREKNPGEKPYAKISNSMRRVVGDKATQFITECSLWVKEYCPLNSRSWIKLEKRAKERLFDKIQGEWNLPRLVGGINVKKTLNSQCAALYRGWRYRLKEEHFVGYSKQQARANRPKGIDEIKWNWLVDFWSDPKEEEKSEKARRNRLKQTIKHSNGAKSTARILEELINVPTTQSVNDGGDNVANANGEANVDGEANFDGDGHVQHDEDPLYVKLYEKTHRHKDGTLDPEAEDNFNQLKELHAKQIEEHGVDNLTPFEAFSKILNECSGYIRGLGYGPKPRKRLRNDVDSYEMRDEIQQLREATTQREAQISSLKSENVLLKQQMEEMKVEMLEREKRMKEELMAEFMKRMQSSKDVN